MVELRDDPPLAPTETWRAGATYLDRADQPPTERPAPPRVLARFAEDAAPAEGLAGTDGVYDGIRFDRATFVDAARLDDRGRFDAGYFNGRTFVDVFATGEFGRYGADRYNHARFARDAQEDS